VFDHAGCAQGLLALREWSYAFNDDTRTYSKDPCHNWASHGADAFTYGALMLRERSKAKPKEREPLPQAAANFTLDQLFVDRERFGPNRRIG
jgi:phage terminase large subunit